MTSGSHTAEQKLNGDVPWDAFDPYAYIARNYLVVQPVDREIVSLVGDHFSDHFNGRDGRVGSGIDVGAGPNLYPALSMLPWCDRITLLERSARNVAYLRGQVDDYDANWDRFWDVLCARPAYEKLGVPPRVRFKEAIRPVPGSLFDLCAGKQRWDMGTMFFVAESITESLDEFRRGVGCFMSALNPGAPFAAAFMEHSEGYRVGEQKFPATYDIDETEVGDVLSEYAKFDKVHRMGEVKHLVRDGHTGILLVCGRRKE